MWPLEAWIRSWTSAPFPHISVEQQRTFKSKDLRSGDHWRRWNHCLLGMSPRSPCVLFLFYFFTYQSTGSLSLERWEEVWPVDLQKKGILGRENGPWKHRHRKGWVRASSLEEGMRHFQRSLGEAGQSNQKLCRESKGSHLRHDCLF